MRRSLCDAGGGRLIEICGSESFVPAPMSWRQKWKCMTAETKILLLLRFAVIRRSNIDTSLSNKRRAFWFGFNKRRVSNKRRSQICAEWLRNTVLIDAEGHFTEVLRHFTLYGCRRDEGSTTYRGTSIASHVTRWIERQSTHRSFKQCSLRDSEVSLRDDHHSP